MVGPDDDTVEFETHVSSGRPVLCSRSTRYTCDVGNSVAAWESRLCVSSTRSTSAAGGAPHDSSEKETRLWPGDLQS